MLLALAGGLPADRFSTERREVNLPAVLTNKAAGLACSPTLFRTTISCWIVNINYSMGVILLQGLMDRLNWN